MVTRRRDGTQVVAASSKPFAWSFSKLKNFEVCPKRYYETDILKNYTDDDNTELAWGTRVHDVMAKRCEKGEKIPDDMPAHYELWAQRVLVGGGELFVEQQLAIDENFLEAPWFAARDGSGRIPWFRAKVDFLKIQGPIALLVDWKTGKIQDESYQLALSCACAFAKWPELEAIRASYVWLKEDAESTEIIKRTDMPHLWRSLWPRVTKLASAHQSMSFPPTPNRTCRQWCRVTSCPNHGKGC